MARFTASSLTVPWPRNGFARQDNLPQQRRRPRHLRPLRPHQLLRPPRRNNSPLKNKNAAGLPVAFFFICALPQPAGSTGKLVNRAIGATQMACQFAAEIGQQLDGDHRVLARKLVEACAVQHVTNEVFVGFDGSRTRLLVE